jgi:hypothetical protein
VCDPNPAYVRADVYFGATATPGRYNSPRNIDRSYFSRAGEAAGMPSRSPLDLLLAFVGWFLLAFGPVSVVGTYAFPPDAVTTLLDFGVTALVAAPLAIWYWKRGRSLGDLGMFFFWVMALTLVFGTSAFGILAATGPVETGSVADLAVTSALLLAVYAGAYHMVYRDGWARFRAALGSA